MREVRPLPLLIGGVGGGTSVVSLVVMMYKFQFPYQLKNSTILYNLLCKHIDLYEIPWGVQICQDTQDAIVFYVGYRTGQNVEEIRATLLQKTKLAADDIARAIEGKALIEAVVKGVVDVESDTDGRT